LCEERLVRADKLINGLADEKIRWSDTVTSLDHMIANIVGDVMASAGFVAYLGAFTVKHKSKEHFRFSFEKTFVAKSFCEARGTAHHKERCLAERRGLPLCAGLARRCIVLRAMRSFEHWRIVAVGGKQFV